MLREEEKGFKEELIECPFCAGFVPDEYECILCGEEILEDEIEGRTKLVCSRCRTDVDEEHEECPNCGVKF